MKTFVFDAVTNDIVQLGTQLRRPYLVQQLEDGKFRCSCPFGVHNDPMFIARAQAEVSQRLKAKPPRTCRHVRAILRLENDAPKKHSRCIDNAPCNATD